MDIRGTYIASNQASVAKSQANEPEKKTLIEEVRKNGFGKYVEDLKEQKKKEMREKILASMKLSEEDLAKMSPGQRAKIEKMIDDEIRKRMTAQSELNKDDKIKLGLHSSTTSQTHPSVGSIIDGAGVGIGPLLILQETEQNTDNDFTQKGKNNRVKFAVR